MNVFIPTRVQRLTLLFPFPLIVCLVYYMLFYSASYGVHTLLTLFLATVLVGLFSWLASVLANNFISSALPGLAKTAARITGIVLAHGFPGISLLTVFFYGSDHVEVFDHHFAGKHFITWAVSSLIFNIIFSVIWQVEYIFGQWTSSMLEKELAEQQLLQREYDNLKRQINPHFLFNNFNILSSLIHEYPQKAIFYLDELSKIYRYLLKNGEDGVSTLGDELSFIRSYRALMDIRYGRAVQIYIVMDDDLLNHLLPSLTLQLLVENAVKHNISSKTKPLIITIGEDGPKRIIVKNNFQKKLKPAPSNRVGLGNIAAKYRLLNHPDIRIVRSKAFFSVSVPLIECVDKDEKASG